MGKTNGITKVKIVGGLRPYPVPSDCKCFPLEVAKNVSVLAEGSRNIIWKVIKGMNKISKTFRSKFSMQLCAFYRTKMLYV